MPVFPSAFREDEICDSRPLTIADSLIDCPFKVSQANYYLNLPKFCKSKIFARVVRHMVVAFRWRKVDGEIKLAHTLCEWDISQARSER